VGDQAQKIALTSPPDLVLTSHLSRQIPSPKLHRFLATSITLEYFKVEKRTYIKKKHNFPHFPMSDYTSLCVISDFHHDVNEIWANLGSYIA
jgi:hypothetical protein